MFENVDAPKDGLFTSGWITYAGVLGISIWGGLVSYFERKGKFSWKNLTAHLMSSAFAGMMVYMGCEYAGISGPLAGLLCGVSAHMGTPALIAIAKKSKTVRVFLEGIGDKDANK